MMEFDLNLRVDPIADQYPHVTVYNYAENEPIAHIDLWGLQKAIPMQQDKNGVQVPTYTSGSTIYEGRNVQSNQTNNESKQSQTEKISSIDKSKSIDHVAISLNAAFIYGGGIEFGQLSDGENIVPYFQFKHGFGIGASASLEVGKSMSVGGSNISFSDLSGSGGENSFSIGPAGYTYSSDKTSGEYGAHKNPSIYRTNTGSFGVGAPVGLTGFSTHTYLGTQRKIDNSTYTITRLKMSGL